MTRKQREELVAKGLSLPLRSFMGEDKAGIRAEMLKRGCCCDSDTSTWVFPDFPTMRTFAKRVAGAITAAGEKHALVKHLPRVDQ